MISISTRQTLVDNIAILSSELLDAINKLAVQAVIGFAESKPTLHCTRAAIHLSLRATSLKNYSADRARDLDFQ